MALSKKFSELPSASSLTNNDLFAIAHEDSGAETGYESQKATATQIAKKILNGIEFPTDLPDFPANEQNPIDALEYLNAKINDLYPIVDVSGSIVNFFTTLTLPLVNLKANITAQQSGTGTPSPTNVRNISGFSSVTLTQKDSEDTTVDTFTISLGDTYYGGVVDIKNGTATITKQIYQVTGDEMEYAITTGGYVRFRTPVSYYGTFDTYNALCNIAPCEVRGQSTNHLTYLQITDFETVDAFKAYAQNNDVFIVYNLITPIELTGLTPDNFTTIVGENNIFADSGDVEVSFRQGIQEYIDAKIAETQALIL